MEPLKPPEPPERAFSSGSVASVDPPGKPLAPWDTLRTLTITRPQGGPSILRCSGVTHRVVVRIADGEWEEGFCRSSAADGPLTLRKGVLSTSQKGALQARYGSLRAEVPKRCMVDGGPTLLEVETLTGATLRWSSDHLCSTPPAEVVTGLAAFVMDLPRLLAP